VFIPFPASSDVNEKGVIVHEGYAQLSDFYLPKEQFYFHCSVLKSEENLMMGSNATFIVSTRLYVGQVRASLSLIEKAVFEVESCNEQDVKTTTKYDQIVLKNDEELVVKYLIPPKLKSLRFKLSGEVQKIDQTTQKVQHEETVGFLTH
jgi:hypothetical protein